MFRLTSQAEHALRFTNLDYDSKYRFIVYGSTAAGDGDPNSKDVLTLPQQFDDRSESMILSYQRSFFFARPPFDLTYCVVAYSWEVQNSNSTFCFLAVVRPVTMFNKGCSCLLKLV